LLLVLGILMSRVMLGAEPTADAIRDTFIWLLLPGALVGVIELFARKGGDWPRRAPKWTLGAVVWGFTIALTLGWVRL
jgi:peptidoglycan/LPS O-acetylase OafA/YrhL